MFFLVFFFSCIKFITLINSGNKSSVKESLLNLTFSLRSYDHVMNDIFIFCFHFIFFLDVGLEGLEPPCNHLRFQRIMSASRYKP